MALKKIKPTTPGQRHKLVVTNDDITATKPEKSLVFGFGKSGGRRKADFFTRVYQVCSAQGLSGLRLCHSVRTALCFVMRLAVVCVYPSYF